MKFPVLQFFRIFFFLVYLILFFAAGFVTVLPMDSSHTGISIFFVIIDIVLIASFIFALYRLGRLLFSKVKIDNLGICLYTFGRREFLLHWSECKEVGIGIFVTGRGSSVHCIYFSKEPLTSQEMQSLNRVRLNNNHLWLQYSKKALDEIVKYVDWKTIKNIDSIK